MKKAILPVVFAVLLVILMKFSVNPQIEITGLVFVAAIGLLVGSLINKIIFKNSEAESNHKDSV